MLNVRRKKKNIYLSFSYNKQFFDDNNKNSNENDDNDDDNNDNNDMIIWTH